MRMMTTWHDIVMLMWAIENGETKKGQENDLNFTKIQI